MFDFLFYLPLPVTGSAIVGSLCLYAALGLMVVRRLVLPRLRIQEGDAEFSSGMVQAVMVFYGLALALIAMNVWQTYNNTAQLVSQEAAAIGGLYRDVSGYPEPARSRLQKELRDYTDYVIHEAWPLQQRGQIPTGGNENVTRFQNILLDFEPVTERQKLLHSETLRAFNHTIESRRLRIDAAGTQLPGILWLTIIVGALISLGSSFFFKIEDARVHGIQVVLLAAFVGMVIFMVMALDRPFIGDLGLKPDSYQIVYDHLMKP